LKKMVKIFIGVLAGGLMGFLYYRFITRNLYLSIIYWALLGGLVANLFT